MVFGVDKKINIIYNIIVNGIVDLQVNQDKLSYYRIQNHCLAKANDVYYKTGL